jgi:hypothetical protein
VRHGRTDRAALEAALAELRRRAASLDDAELRAAYLELPVHRRRRALAAETG